MQLFTMSVFKGRPVCIQNGWRVSDEGILLIQGPDGQEKLFPRLTVREDVKKHPLLILDGNVCADGNHGTIYRDGKKIKNRYKFLLLVVTEANMELPEQLYYDHRVRIDPVANKEGSLVASIVCFLKTEELFFGFENELGKNEILLSYDNSIRFPKTKEVVISQTSLFKRRRMWNNFRKSLRLFSCKLFTPYHP
jgi:hypothetical protein